MNPLHDSDLASQQARAWSGRLGSLAATSPATGPDAGFTQLDSRHPAAFPARLLSILDNLRQRAQRRQQAADKLSANEFMMAPYRDRHLTAITAPMVHGRRHLQRLVRRHVLACHPL
jgi:hypothetical protein